MTVPHAFRPDLLATDADWFLADHALPTERIADLIPKVSDHFVT